MFRNGDASGGGTDINLPGGGTLQLQGVDPALINANHFLFIDPIVGTAGDDVPLDGTAGVDFILGLAGDDTLNGLDSDDILAGGPGSDTW